MKNFAFFHLILLAGNVAISTAEDVWKINYITPNLGSENGGTQLTVFGTGFDTDLNLDYTKPSKRLYLVNDFQTYECDINIAASDEDQVVCETRSMPQGSYYIRMEQHEENLDSKQYCGGNSKNSRCRFTVYSWRTPYITGLDWRTGETKQELSIRGRIFTNKTSSSEESASNGVTAAVQRVYTGDSSCVLFDDENDNLPFGVTLDGDEGESVWGDMTCRMQGSLVGNQNVSFIVNEDYGRSLSFNYMYLLSQSNKLFMLQTYAVITDVNPKQGSIVGGTELTIQGRGFYNDTFSEAKVYVGGVACAITEVTPNQIKCITPEQPESKTVYSGGRGLIVEMFPDNSNFSATLDSTTADRKFFIDQSHVTNDYFKEENYFLSRSRGFFIPHVDGNYFFLFKADDEVEFRFNPNGIDPAGATDRVKSQSIGVFRGGHSYDLTAGKSYYYEIRHRDATHNAYFHLDVYTKTSSYTSKQTSLSITDKQTVTISAPVVKEVQTVVFEDWATENPLETVWSLEMSCGASSCDGVQFYFSLFETNSDPIQYSSGLTPTAIQIVLGSLVVLGSDDVEVTGSNNIFAITFKSNRGHMPLKVTSLSTDLQVELTVVTTGKPSLESFTFTVNGKVSPSVDYDGSANDVKAAVTSLFGPICPPEVESRIGTAKLYYDIEDNKKPSGSKSSDASYCGSFSLKNPSNLFNDANNPYVAQFFPHVCFAYKGMLSSRVDVWATYVNVNEEGVPVGQTKRFIMWFTNEITQQDGWKHVCLNMPDKFKEAEPDGLNFFIQQIRVYRSSSEDVYLDNIFIGKSKFETTELTVYRQRIVPSAVEHIKVESIDVVKTDNAYEITYNPIDCGFNFPLLGIAFGNLASNLNNRAQYQIGGNSAMVHVFRNSSASHPVTGNFELSFDDPEFGSLEDLPSDISPSELKTRLETLKKIDEVYVTRNGECTGYSWEISFVSPGGDYPNIVPSISSLTSSPGPVTITPSFQVNGGMRIAPIYGDFFRTAHDLPQVQVNIHGIPSACLGPDGSNTFDQCNYEWAIASTPTITAVSPTAVSQGDILTITGTGFDSQPTLNVVTVGGVNCDVKTSSSTSLTCEIQNSPLGTLSIGVTVKGKGKAKIGVSSSNEGARKKRSSDQSSAEELLVEVQPKENVVTFERINGYKSIKLSHKFVKVTVGDKECKIVNETCEPKTTCEVPDGSGKATVKVYWTEDSSSSLEQTYTYESEHCAVNSADPDTFNTQKGNTVTLTGSGFGDNVGQIIVGCEEINDISTWNDITIKFTINQSFEPGSYPIQVIPKDLASCYSSQISLKLLFSLTGISPSIGSLIGNTEVNITGSGFVMDMVVKLDDLEHRPTYVNNDGTLATFNTQSSADTHLVQNSGEHSKYGLGYAWNPEFIAIGFVDEVQFSWSQQNFIETSFDIGMFTVEKLHNKVYDEQSFNISARKEGSRVVALNNEGNYLYTSECLIEEEDECNLAMTGGITVLNPVQVSKNVSLHLNGKQANSEQDSFKFVYSPENTPRLTSLSINEGHVGDDITISGSLLETTSKVMIGKKACTLTSKTNSRIICHIDGDEELEVGIDHEVVVTTKYGLALWQLLPVEKRLFRLLPEVTKINTNCGSLAGGTTVVLEGFGLNSQYLTFDSLPPCNTMVKTYTNITCIASSKTEDTSSDLKMKLGEEPVRFANGVVRTFSHSDSCTPKVTSVSCVGTENLDVTITGSGFGNGDDEVHLQMTRLDLLIEEQVNEVTDSNISHVVEMFQPAGKYNIVVKHETKGFALFANGVDDFCYKGFSLTSIIPDHGSTEGGTLVQITGNGFTKMGTSISMGSASCGDITYINDKKLTCMTGKNTGSHAVSVQLNDDTPYNTNLNFSYLSSSTPQITSMLPNNGPHNTKVNFSGNFLTSKVSDITVTVDDVECKINKLENNQLEVEMPSYKAGKVVPKIIVSNHGYSNNTHEFEYNLQLSNVEPREGSFGGGQTLFLQGSGFSTNMNVTICDAPCLLDVSSMNTTYARCVTPSMNQDTNSKICDVLIEVDELESRLSSHYSFESTLTCMVSKITPNRGGTGGGTKIEITGSNFNNVDVVIDGSKCITKSETSSKISCETEPHVGSIVADISLTCGSNGQAVIESGVHFEYVDRWSSKFTWGGNDPPKNGSFVIIGKNDVINLDTSTNLMKMLLIDGGTLKFDEETEEEEIILNAENILVVNGGTLQVGTEEKPYLKKAKIIMHGNLRSPELPIYGAKTLGIREGTLDLHGKPIAHPWTLLAETASAGSTTIKVQHSLKDWNVGDKIVIASTGTRHSQKENEEREIESVSADGMTLTLKEPLEYSHFGETRSLSCGSTIEYRAEVGLLSRNIVFRGSDDPQWHDDIPACKDDFETGQFATQTCFQGRFGEETGSDEFGASIMIHSPPPAEKGSSYISARIENIEVTYAGQAFRLGRYPIHWHLMGNMSGNYVKSCSIHKTFNRAVTIHGTHNLLVERNVIYNVKGGGVFIEDGIETGNIIQYNLAVFVIQSTSLLTEDITPAAYWVTNPDNIIRHNHGAGGTHFCFWYRMNEHPDGPSFRSDVCQQNVELGEFSNNTCHSQGWFGLWVFPTYFPIRGGSCNPDWYVPSPAKFNSLTAWRCEKGAEWVNCGAMHFIDFKLVDHEDAGMDLKLVTNAARGPDQGALVQNAIISGHTDDVIQETKHGIILPFSGNLNLDNVCLENFDKGGIGFRLTSIQGLCTELCGGFEMYFKNMRFHNVNKLIRFRWTHEAVLIDEDGTLLKGNKGRRILVPHTDIMDPQSCQIQTDSYYSGDVAAAICNGDVTFNRLALNQALPSSLEANDLYVKNQFGNTSSLYAKKRLTHKTGWMILLQSKQRYTMWWKNGEQFTNLTYNAKYFNFRKNDYLIMTHDLTQRIDRVLFNNNDGSEVDTLTLSSTNDQYSYDTTTKKLSYVVSHDEKTRSYSGYEPYNFTSPHTLQHYPVSPSIIRCAVAGCKVADPSIPLPPDGTRPNYAVYWSESHSCTNEKCRIPRLADDGSLCWVILNENITDCDHLNIEGVAEVDEKADHIVIEAKTILVTGRLIAGYFNNTFKGKFDLILVGNHSTPGLTLQFVDLGSKAIGVLGGLDLHGGSPVVHWTRLGQTANVGENEIVLEEEVDWKVGDEIVITTTGYRAQETEKRFIKSVNGKTLVLSKALDYRHLSFTGSIKDRSYEMKAEVGLLTRNIRIIGKSYNGIQKQAFGARVLIAGGFQGTKSFTGWARVTNVEFFQTGQEGWTESYDPRFSLTWLNTGETSDKLPSYAKQNAFHDGFSTAIGTFGATGIEISDNVIHRTIHDGIRITGANHVLKRNLVTMSLFRGAWDDRFEITNFKDWHACFEISQAENLTLEGNVAAGSERLGFHTDGEACGASEENAWKDNVAHGCLHGLHIFVNDGVGDCSMLRNFLVYKSWDYGVYFQTPVSVVVRNTVVVDSVVSFMPIIINPASLSHQYADKCVKYEDVTCVGKSQPFDPELDFMNEKQDKNLLVRSAGPDRKAPRRSAYSFACIVLPIFASVSNNAPFKGFHFQMSYPAILGSLSITGLYAHRYQTLNGHRDLVFWTCPTNEDANHPVITKNTFFSEVEKENIILIDRASISKVNPSDCVDMECDAKKKVFIKDLDGSILNSPGAIISQSEYAWGGDKRLGLGDFRIPTTFLTDDTGKRRNLNQLIDARGIIRTPSCTYNDQWQAYNCHGAGTLDYRMLVIESMDSDTETRRLSPLAVIGDKYIDLINGPQDHGWCFGYTCQKRISTFWAVVANNKSFEIYFTGYAPRHLRLRVIKSDTCSGNGISGFSENTDLAILVSIFYARPERLDVHLKEQNNVYIHPRNSHKDPDTGKWVLSPEKSIPLINAKGRHGDNYFSPSSRQQYVLLTEESPVDINTAPAVYVKMGFQAITIDEFFGKNLVSNIANFLGIAKENIQVVDIVRETSRRKRSGESFERAEFTLMFSNAITNDSSVDPDDSVAIEAFNNGSKALIIAMQTDVLSQVVNSTITSFAASVINHNLTGDVVDDFNVVYTVPSTITVESLPSSVEEQTQFPNPITATLLDVDGNPVSTLDGVFEVTVTMNTSAAGANPSATLLGDTSMMFVNGTATFSNLMISHEGTYQLNFQITQPVNVQVSSTMLPSIIVTQRTVNLDFVSSAPSPVYHGNEIPLNLQLQDSALQPLQNVGYKGHTWKLEVSLDDSSLYSASLGTTNTFTFNTDGVVTTTGLNLMNTISFFQYGLRCRAYTEPALYDIIVYTNPIKFAKETEMTDLSRFVNFYTGRVIIKGRPHLSRSSSHMLPTMVNYISNMVTKQMNNNETRVDNMAGSESGDNTEIRFSLGSTSEAEAEMAFQEVENLFNGSSRSLSYKGMPLRFSDSCGLQVNNNCRGTTTTSAVPSQPFSSSWIFIIVGLVVAVILSALIITFACVMKRAKLNKVGLIGGNCLDASSSRGATPLFENSLGGSTQMTTPGAGSQAEDFSQWDKRMTPVQN